MTNPDFITNERGQKLAYHYIPPKDKTLPSVVFLGGFRSDMNGSKAMYLQDWAGRHGRGFLRFDYSGHGQSDGVFERGCIGEWAADAADVINAVTQGAQGGQILVGSSMGGWISLLLATRRVAKRKAVKIAGFVGIAAAPDFTATMWDGMNEKQRATMVADGTIDLPSDYDTPYTISHKLILDGADNFVLNTPLAVKFPTRLLWGADDKDVSRGMTLRLLDHMEGADIRLYIVKNADHGFSSPPCLGLIQKAIHSVTKAIPS